LAQHLEKSPDVDVEYLTLLKEAIVNCRQNEVFLRVMQVKSVLTFIYNITSSHLPTLNILLF